jgi:hypothetical protein
LLELSFNSLISPAIQPSVSFTLSISFFICHIFLLKSSLISENAAKEFSAARVEKFFTSPSSSCISVR